MRVPMRILENSLKKEVFRCACWRISSKTAFATTNLRRISLTTNHRPPTTNTRNSQLFQLRLPHASGEYTPARYTMSVQDSDISWQMLRRIVHDWMGSSAELAEVKPLTGGSIATTL